MHHSFILIGGDENILTGEFGVGRRNEVVY